MEVPTTLDRSEEHGSEEKGMMVRILLKCFGG
jgi:hypothetical protein